jgi:phage major head subunit gpT-like protein
MAQKAVTPAAIRALHTQFSGLFQRAFEGQEIFRDRLATTVPSSSKSNTYGWMAKLPRMREWLGERTVNAIAAHGYTIVNKDWELTVGVDRNDFEDENLGIYSPVVEMMGQEVAKHPDDLLIRLLQKGHEELGFDGQPFFDTDHPVDMFDASKGTQSNHFTSSALTDDNLQAARTAVMSFKGENGRPLGLKPDLLIVPPALEKTARTILNAQTIFKSDSNGAAAPTNVMAGLMNLLVIPELAGEDTTWYTAVTTRAVKGLIFQNRRPAKFVAKTSVDDDNVWRYNRYEWGVDPRYNAGYGLWFLMTKAVA